MKAIFGLLFISLAVCAGPALSAGGIVKTGVKQSHFSAKPAALRLRSSAVLVLAQDSGEPLFAKNIDQIMPIASITKLLTAMVVLDSGLPLLAPIDMEKRAIHRLEASSSQCHARPTRVRPDRLTLPLMA